MEHMKRMAAIATHDPWNSEGIMDLPDGTMVDEEGNRLDLDLQQTIKANTEDLDLAFPTLTNLPKELDDAEYFMPGYKPKSLGRRKPQPTYLAASSNKISPHPSSYSSRQLRAGKGAGKKLKSKKGPKPKRKALGPSKRRGGASSVKTGGARTSQGSPVVVAVTSSRDHDEGNDDPGRLGSSTTTTEFHHAPSKATLAAGDSEYTMEEEEGGYDDEDYYE